MQTEQKANILLVDDHPENLLALEAILEGLGQNLIRANSGEEALKKLLKDDFAVILLDVQMPGMDGFETASLIRSREKTRHTPIIFLTAINKSDTHVSRGYSLGAVDYMIKPIDPDILASKVAVFVDLFNKTEEVKRQKEKEAATAAVQKRLTFLAEASSTLALSLDYETTLANMTRVVVPTLADYCVVDLLQDDGHLRQVAVTHIDASKEELVKELRTEHGSANYTALAQEVLRSGQARLFSERENSLYEELANSSERLYAFRESLLPRSFMIVPLIARGRGLGVLSFISTNKHRSYDLADLALAENIANRAAYAIDNAMLYRQAQDANRLKDEFLATVSHELRTPLNAMLGWTRLLRSGKLDESSGLRALETIERNVKAQAQLIEDLLDISRIITGKLHLDVRPIELQQLIKAAIEAVRPAADAKDIQLQVILDPWTGPISGDPIRLQQVVWNLLSNAIKFTPPGGKATIKLERVGEQVEINVSDSGKGISQEFLPFVFDRFRQADSSSTREFGGLGLGLAIVRHLVEMHGGTIQADSQGEGFGATFCVRLPLMAAMHEEPALPNRRLEEKSEPPPALDGLRVLVVDDETDTREMIGLALEQCGAQVKLAQSVDQALRTLDSWWPDVLVSDIAMPGRDGYELIREVRSREVSKGRRVPSVALTAYAKAEDRLRALSAGFQMHVPKPIEPAELAAVLANLSEWIEKV